jgi:hypothetical protein
MLAHGHACASVLATPSKPTGAIGRRGSQRFVRDAGALAAAGSRIHARWQGTFDGSMRGRAAMNALARRCKTLRLPIDCHASIRDTYSCRTDQAARPLQQHWGIRNTVASAKQRAGPVPASQLPRIPNGTVSPVGRVAPAGRTGASSSASSTATDPAPSTIPSWPLRCARSCTSATCASIRRLHGRLRWPAPGRGSPALPSGSPSIVATVGARAGGVAFRSAREPSRRRRCDVEGSPGGAADRSIAAKASLRIDRMVLFVDGPCDAPIGASRCRAIGTAAHGSSGRRTCRTTRSRCCAPSSTRTGLGPCPSRRWVGAPAVLHCSRANKSPLACAYPT